MPVNPKGNFLTCISHVVRPLFPAFVRVCSVLRSNTVNVKGRSPLNSRHGEQPIYYPWKRLTMAEGLLPHHHIIRRAGPAINKYLNLSDEGLVGRLIASGCISEKDKDKYTGKTKRVRDRFIARFQNQPYELFLTFVECLRRDEKYVKLVTILDEALAEYGYVPPATSASESREKDTIHLQSEDVPSLSEQERSPTTTGG